MPFGFGKGRRRGWGRGRGFRRERELENGARGRLPTNCICPQCGWVEPHQPGTPCFQTICPRCGSVMTRTFPRE